MQDENKTLRGQKIQTREVKSIGGSKTEVLKCQTTTSFELGSSPELRTPIYSQKRRHFKEFFHRNVRNFDIKKSYNEKF